jgi:hypothetical protein
MAKHYRKEDDDAPAPGEDAELERFKKWYRSDVLKTNLWRGGTKENGGAKEDFKFRDGDQWSDEDKAWLEDQDRAYVEFNRTGVLVDAVVGVEVGNRRVVRYTPRDVNDSKPNEVLTSAAEWFRDLCDAEDEESEAFKDTVTAGMGWTETRLDRKENPDGEPKIERIDPFEMVWDCNAVKANLVDRKRTWRVRKMDIADAMNLLPDADPDELNASWADNDSEETKPHSNDREKLYDQGEVDGKIDRMVTIVALQYKEEETYYKALINSPDGPQTAELDEAKFKIAEKQGAVLKAAKLTRETVKQVFLGKSVLKKPAPTQTGMFTWHCITGLKDEDKGIFYGIVRRAKSPQRWANKWLTQILHILNSQAKGGVIVDKNAVEDVRAFEESWAKTEAVTWVKQGKADGIMPKPMAQFPAGFAQLMQYADEMIVKATGINMELLGIREVNQPGVLEYQRKQAGMGILAVFFDSLRRYRKIQGRVMLNLIQNNLSDGRLIRIVGDDEAKYVPLMKQEGIDKAKAEAEQQMMQQAPQMIMQAIEQGMPPDQAMQQAQQMIAAEIEKQFGSMKPVEGEYDIIVDDSPTSPNDKEKSWQIIQSMLPMFKDQIGPAQIKVIAKYSPLPISFMEDLDESMNAPPPPPSPEQVAMMELEKGKIANEQAKIQNDANKIAAEREKIVADLEIARIDQANEVERQRTERQKLGVEQTQAMADIETAQKPEKEATSARNGKMDEIMQMMAAAMQMMSAPKRRTPIRDPQTNRIVDVIEQPIQ